MAYLLIYDLDGASGVRRKIHSYLRQNAEMVQHSVWRFRNYAVLLEAAEQVLAVDGKVLAFVDSDRILLDEKDVGKLLGGVGAE